MGAYIHLAINKDKYTARVTSSAKLLFILLGLFIMPAIAFAQITPAQSDTMPTRMVVLPVDTLIAAPAQPDTLSTDSVAKPVGYRSPIDTEIVYDARDSIDNDVINKKVYLYGDAVVTYGNITLKAAMIEYDFGSYTVRARGVQDSLGIWSGLPNFKDAGSEFDAFTMDYNFRTRKAYVRKVLTEVIEGTLTGNEVKTIEGGDIIYVRRGEYCPCEDPNAKTRFKIGRLKVIRNDKIVTGPGYLTLWGVPTPVAFPFGFFPNTDKKQAGIIIPSYGNGQSRGYFLNNLGFYMPINEYVDTKILTDIYSRGSWGLENQTNYNRRYKYSGGLNASYFVGKLGDRDLQNFSEERNFFLNWRHNQDPKAKPNSTFSADLNMGSSATFRNNINASQNDFLSNTFRSNVRYQQRFYDSPWSFNINAGHDQNSRGGTDGQAVYNFILPELTLNRARTFPLAGLFNSSPRQKFYEKIGVTYSSVFRNTLTAEESDLSFGNWNSLQSQFRNGVRHGVAVSTSFKMGPVSINPSYTYNERWYFSTIDRRFDPDLQGLVTDTVRGFDRNNDWNMAVSATTKIYGMYSFKSGKIKAIRHTLTPSVSYSVRPDFDPRIFGFFGPDGTLTSYSPYDGAIFGGPPSGRSSLINFSLLNNLEAKMLSRKDTASKFVKVPLMENLTVGGSYNIAADSLRLTPISIAGRTSITQYANINFRGLFEPYSYVGVSEGSGGVRRVNVLRYEREGKVASFENGNVALNANGISNATFKRQKAGPTPASKEGSEAEPAALPTKSRWSSALIIPWNLTFGYSLDARKVRESIMLSEGFAIRDSLVINQSIQMNGGFELFKRIKVNFNSGYDFVNKELTPTTILIGIDLNCWEFNARVVPFGFRRSYNLALNIKSSMLRDLKFEQNRILTDGEGFFF